MDKSAAWLKPTGAIAVLFGLFTIMSGGAVLFSGEAAAKTHPGFLLWWNFLGGFLYGAAGLGLWFGKRWAALLAFLIAASALLVLAAYGLHASDGGAYDLGAVEGMVFRLAAWLVISLIAYRWIWRPAGPGTSVQG